MNQVGQRFYNELAFPRSRSGDAKFPPGSDGTRKDFTPLDWRNCSVEQIKSQYRRTDAVDAALAMNEGSQPPDYSSGPSWAIFDQAAVDRGGWELRFPFIANPPDGSFFKADTLEELARKVTGNEFQRMPLKHLVKTIARYNELAASGKDTDFDKPRLHRIDTPPLLRGDHSDRYERLVRWHPHQWQGASHRPVRAGDRGPLCRRRGKRQWRAAWSRPRHRPRLYRRYQCRERGPELMFRAREQSPGGVSPPGQRSLLKSGGRRNLE